MADTLESLAAAVAALKTQVEALSKQLGEGRAGFSTESVGSSSPEPIETFRVAAPVSAPDILIAGRSVEKRINANRGDIGRLEELTDGRISKIEAGEIPSGDCRLAGRAALRTDDDGRILLLGSDEFESGVNVVGSTLIDDLECSDLRVDNRLSIFGEVFSTRSIPFQTDVDFKQVVKVDRIKPLGGGTVLIDGKGLTVAGFVHILDQLRIGRTIDETESTTTAGGIHAEGVIMAKQFVPTGGDIAEHIPVRAGVDATPGMVMVIADDGDLVPCSRDHDHRVAGVIAGAGGLETALLMKPGGDKGMPIALAGTVYCNCDADHGAIAPGDLLTTSTTPGFARCTPAAEVRPGTVIGKALSALDRGRGQILMLVGHR